MANGKNQILTENYLVKEHIDKIGSLTINLKTYSTFICYQQFNKDNSTL